MIDEETKTIRCTYTYPKYDNLGDRVENTRRCLSEAVHFFRVKIGRNLRDSHSLYDARCEIHHKEVHLMGMSEEISLEVFITEPIHES